MTETTKAPYAPIIDQAIEGVISLSRVEHVATVSIWLENKVTYGTKIELFFKASNGTTWSRSLDVDISPTVFGFILSPSLFKESYEPNATVQVRYTLMEPNKPLVHSETRSYSLVE